MKKIVAMLLSFALAFGTVLVYGDTETELADNYDNTVSDEITSDSSISSGETATDNDTAPLEIESYRLKMPDRSNITPPPEIQKIIVSPDSEKSLKLMAVDEDYEYPLKNGKLSAEVKNQELYVTLSCDANDESVVIIASRFNYDGNYREYTMWQYDYPLGKGEFSDTVTTESGGEYEHFVPLGTSSAISIFVLEAKDGMYFDTLKPMVKPLFIEIDPSGNMTEVENSIEESTEATTEDPEIAEAKNYISSLRTSNYDGEWFNFVVSNNVFGLTGKIIDTEKNYYVLDIIKSDETEEKNYEIRKNFSENNDSEVSLQDVNLSGLADGMYAVKIYGNKDGLSEYFGIMEVRLVVREGTAYLIRYNDVYESNLKLRSYAERNHSMDYWIGDNYGLFTTNAAGIKQIQALAEEITNGCTSDYDKILALHDYVAANVNYDYDFFNGKTESTYLVDIDVLNGKKSVCQGYCALFLSMARKLGIHSRVVDGWSKSQTSYGGTSWEERLKDRADSDHAWVEAYDSDNDRWIIMDVTWDSPGKVEDGYVSGDKDPIGHRYFDITDEAFAYDHKTQLYEANGIG